jgi:predicted metalloprotease
MVKTIVYVATKVDKNVKYSEKLFNKKVKTVLTDPKGWQRIANVKFKFVDWDALYALDTNHYKIPIRLSTYTTIKYYCGFGNLSCCDMSSKEVWLNFSRWINGATASKLDLYKYRDYMINHEVGHALGREHVTCPEAGQKAPIMMQHTVTIGKCTPNNHPLKGE